MRGALSLRWNEIFTTIAIHSENIFHDGAADRIRVHQLRRRDGYFCSYCYIFPLGTTILDLPATTTKWNPYSVLETAFYQLQIGARQ